MVVVGAGEVVVGAGTVVVVVAGFVVVVAGGCMTGGKVVVVGTDVSEVENSAR